MPIDLSPEEPDGDDQDRKPFRPLTNNQRRIRQWYLTAIRLRGNGRNDEALDYFKRIYELDYSYKDVAMIVESSYQ